MAFDAFDEGIALGGVRSKTEVRILICYLLASVDVPMTKENVIDALLEKGLTNYFEASSCFDDLADRGNIKKLDDNPKYYVPTENGRTVARDLADNLPLTVRERAYECALNLLLQEKNERENKVSVEKCDHGYNMTCSISGGDMNLMEVSLFLADSDQVKTVKKNFYKNPQLFYKVMIAVMTRNKALIKDALQDLDNLA
ncbi:MAG: DUF4364 family protein [Eubacteriales bacterium]|nr:DUF4364 family protein [Eubacteriales bacterium]